MLGIEVGGDELVLEELGEQMMVEDREDVCLVSVVETSSQSIQVPEIPRRAYCCNIQVLCNDFMI